MTRLAITSMYGNPIHPGHIECLELSRELADELWVIVNNDLQAHQKRWVHSFQNEKYRMKIIESLKPVDRVFLSIDTDATVCESLKIIIAEAKLSGKYTEIIFTKWGDRFAYEIPEGSILKKEGVRIVDGLWNKLYHSSDIIKQVVSLEDEKKSEKARYTI